MRNKIAIIIPAHNEARAIGKVIDNIKKEMKKTSYDFATIVVNDCSTDNTSVVAKKSGSIVIDHILNIGGSGSNPTLTGLELARQNNFDIAVTVDADGQHNVNDVIKGIEMMQKTNADLLVGNRLANNSGMSKTKIIGNQGLSLITRLLFGTKISDSQSGLRVYSRNAIEKLSWKADGFEFCSEMIWRAQQANLKTDEFPIQAIYTDYSRSKGQNNWNGINIVKALVRQRFTEIFE